MAGGARTGADEASASSSTSGGSSCSSLPRGLPERPADFEYGCDLGRLPASVARQWVALGYDEETAVFVRSCLDDSSSLAMAGDFLRCCMSITDANGYLGRCHMHVFSARQAELLLRRSFGGHCAGAPRFARLLDVGAGDGHVTGKLAEFADKVVATDVSPYMVERLAERGFCAIRTGEATREALGEHAAGGATFDLVALLNVLDRASRPRTLLRQLVGLLTPVAGRLVLAVVLPFRPGVEDGTAWLDPEEELPIFGASWEDALSQLVVEVLEPMGFRVEAASRVPYVSQGDWHTNYYVLSDALLVLSAPSRGGAAGETASGDTAAA